MNDTMVTTNDWVQRNCDFNGKLTAQGQTKSLTLYFASPVHSAKVITKHETGDRAYGAVKAIDINGNNVTVKMSFSGTLGGWFDTTVVVNAFL